MINTIKPFALRFASAPQPRLPLDGVQWNSALKGYTAPPAATRGTAASQVSRPGEPTYRNTPTQFGPIVEEDESPSDFEAFYA